MEYRVLVKRPCLTGAVYIQITAVVFRCHNQIIIMLCLCQILTQEDWNVVLFNGMEKTSHWAALYFVALMTFGNYVLFNLLVAILVEGFSSEVCPLSYRNTKTD